MNENDKNRLYPQNPLGIIALFVFFIEAIATISLKFVVESQTAYVGHLVWFIILFPSSIAILFFFTLWLKRESLYTPTDYRSDESFVQLIKKIEVKQDAAQIDPQGSFKNILDMIRKLVSLNEIETAIYLGGALFKVQRYEDACACFEYIERHVPKIDRHYHEILANIAYSHIGLKQYDKAITILNKIYDELGDTGFNTLYAIAFAYSKCKVGQSSEYKQWLDYAKKRKEYTENIVFLKKRYSDIANDLMIDEHEKVVS